MDTKTFHDWCNLAVEKIRYTPDREAVYAELKAHLEDRYQAYREQGLTDSEATERTLHAMGDAGAIAPQLAQIHRPFWGYLYSVSRWIVRFLLCLILCMLIRSGINAIQDNRVDPYEHYTWNPYTLTVQEDDEAARTPLDCKAPDTSYTDSGYTVTLSDAARWLVDWKNPNLADTQEFYFRLDITTPCFWANAPTFTDWFWAEDSLGNRYYGDKETLRFYDDEERYHHYLESTHDIIQNSPFSYSCYLKIQVWKGERVEGIQWIDLHYDRGGRDMVFRIDLTGGKS